jgi:hypothetical protein
VVKKIIPDGFHKIKVEDIEPQRSGVIWMKEAKATVACKNIEDDIKSLKKAAEYYIYYTSTYTEAKDISEAFNKPKKVGVDSNKLAKYIVDSSTGDIEPKKEPSLKAKRASKGGNARAKILSKTRRSEIAKKAAKKRWGKKD